MLCTDVQFSFFLWGPAAHKKNPHTYWNCFVRSTFLQIEAAVAALYFSVVTRKAATAEPSDQHGASGHRVVPLIKPEIPYVASVRYNKCWRRRGSKKRGISVTFLRAGTNLQWQAGIRLSLRFQHIFWIFSDCYVNNELTSFFACFIGGTFRWAWGLSLNGRRDDLRLFSLMNC